MITRTRPDDMEHGDWQPRVRLDKSLLDLVGAMGWHVAVNMYNRPYETFPNPPESYIGNVFPRTLDFRLDEKVNQQYWLTIQLRLSAYSALFSLGMIGTNGEGYQLTADGRYYVKQGLAKMAADEERMKRQWEREEREYHAYSHMDVW